MNKVILALLLLPPLLVFAQRSELSKKYPEVDWSDLSSWPNEINKDGIRYTLVVVQGIGDIRYPPIKGRKPTKEESDRWGAANNAWYQPVEKSELYEFGIYGPSYKWDRADEIMAIRYSDAKGTIKQYDKNGKVFRIEKRNKDGYVSIFYIGKYGREALEFRGRDRTYLQYRKPCSEAQFYEIKNQILKRFELHKPIEKYYP